jgi:hypothetical protein
VAFGSSLEGPDEGDYDRFVLETRGGHYAQTRAWAKVARASRPCVARYFLARDGQRVVGAALLLRTSVGPVPLPVASVDRGPVCASVEDVPRVVRALCRSARRRGVARLSVMPYWAGDEAAKVSRDLEALRFRDVQEPDGAHATTLRVDIAGKSDDALFAAFVRDQVKKRSKIAEKAGARARKGEAKDLEAHRRLMGEMLAAQGKRDRPRAFYDALAAHLDDPRRGALFVCEHEGDIVSTVVVLRHGALATYVFGATSSAPKKFTKTVPPLVAAIRWARDAGCATFDLGGVPSAEDADAKRASIAEFKFYFASERVPLVREHARWG